LDNLAAEVAASNTTVHPDYALLAARIAVSNLHKETKKVFKFQRNFRKNFGESFLKISWGFTRR